MITHVKTKGLKGFNIDEEVPQFALYTGKNKSGKSTRSEAIALAMLGNIPFSATGKRPGDILDNLGDGKSLTVSVVWKGTELERKYSKSEKGSVSQTLRIDKKKVGVADFHATLAKIDIPKIADVNEFMSQSDQKKIDTLFDLYSTGDLKNLDEEIEDAKAIVSKINKDVDAVTSVVQRLTRAKSEIEVPAGTLAEVQNEINEKTSFVRQIQDEIKQLEIAEAERVATEKAKLEAERKAKELEARRETEEKAKQIEAEKAKQSQQQAQQQELPLEQRVLKNIEEYEKAHPEEALEANKEYPFKHDPAESIKKIISAMMDAGCEICAGLIVAKQELKKYEVK